MNSSNLSAKASSLQFSQKPFSALLINNFLITLNGLNEHFIICSFNKTKTNLHIKTAAFLVTKTLSTSLRPIQFKFASLLTTKNLSLQGYLKPITEIRITKHQTTQRE
jgi:hypothetical protein